jgi:hypothetical protein
LLPLLPAPSASPNPWRLGLLHGDSPSLPPCTITPCRKIKKVKDIDDMTTSNQKGVPTKLTVRLRRAFPIQNLRAHPPFFVILSLDLFIYNNSNYLAKYSPTPRSRIMELPICGRGFRQSACVLPPCHLPFCWPPPSGPDVPGWWIGGRRSRRFDAGLPVSTSDVGGSWLCS